MTVKRVQAGLLVLLGVQGACSGDEGAPPVAAEMSAEMGAEMGDAPSASVSPLLPEGAALEPSSCDAAECPEVLLFGVLAPGCCRYGNLCGGRVQVSDSTSACLSPEVNEQGEVLRNALTRGARQPFVPDVDCPSHIVDGDELSGCCRAGVCGVDTQPWTSSAAAFGLQLPRACLDPSEAAELAGDAPVTLPSARCD